MLLKMWKYAQNILKIYSDMAETWLDPGREINSPYPLLISNTRVENQKPEAKIPQDIQLRTICGLNKS